MAMQIGDKQSAALKTPKEYRAKIREARKHWTRPELEMLLLVLDGPPRVKACYDRHPTPAKKWAYFASLRKNLAK